MGLPKQNQNNTLCLSAQAWEKKKKENRQTNIQTKGIKTRIKKTNN